MRAHMAGYGDPANAAIAKDTLRIIAEGGFTRSDGTRVDLKQAIFRAEVGTRTVSPEELEKWLSSKRRPNTVLKSPARIHVTGETTQEATHRLMLEGDVDPAVLNFASATRAGGGFLTGARAQEEDLCRCSALHPCLATQTEFYALHRMQASHLFTDRIIYSPKVPFFRIHAKHRLDHAYEASVITAAAPNVTKLKRDDVFDPVEVEVIMRRRVGNVLALAEHFGHRVLVLGAWGCGVFGNDPVRVADDFGSWLASLRFSGSFDRVVFPVFDPRPGKPNFQPFFDRLDRGSNQPSE